ncbi:hypothetical protein N9L71_01570 [Verrucomicrobiales bacterium]|nr:hypothetical protein [Verrucomicrobiales bacterium]
MTKKVSAPIKVTSTGLSKSCADVPVEVQEFLRDTGFHNFEAQELGSTIPIEALDRDGQPVEIRLSRPNAKRGRFRRISLTRALIDTLVLESDDLIVFEVTENRLRVSKLETMDNQTDVSEANAGRPNTYPDRFLSWMGSGSGSVKRPFNAEAGRPLGNVLETPLIKKLVQLASGLAAGTDSPRLIILAGGAGNGKSDALEEFLTCLASHGPSTPSSIELLKTAFSTPERVITLNAEEVFDGMKLPFKSLVVVQDATEGDDSGQTAGELLVRDLKPVAANGDDTLVICCINRGILEEARLSARRSNSTLEVSHLLETCTRVLDPTSVSEACWPISTDGSVYVWPLDLDSLADGVDSGSSVIEQVVTEVTAAEWDSEFPVTSALAQNKSLLENPDILSGLARMVSDHEILSGRRWAFRDLFILLANLFTGGWIRGDGEAPSEAASRLALPEEGCGPDKLVNSTFDALRATIPQLLFPRWPSHVQLGHWMGNAITKLQLEETSIVSTFLRYLESSDPKLRSSTEELLAAEWSDFLDPALGLPPGWTLDLGEDPTSERDIEDRFNLSIENGLALVSSKLGDIEESAISLLMKAEEEVQEALQLNRDSEALMLALRLQGWLRRLACSLVKRHLGFITGQGHESDIAREFTQSIMDDGRFKEELRTLRRILIHDNRYRVPLNLGLGQPRSTESDGPFMDVQMPRIKEGPPPEYQEERPMNVYREFLVSVAQGEGKSGSLPLPYTIELFRRLKLYREGLLDGCLDPMLRSCLDQLRVIMDGRAARCWGQAELPIEIHLPGELGQFNGFPDELEFEGAR